MVRFCGDFRPLHPAVLVSAGVRALFATTFGALSLHPKIPFPAAGRPREFPAVPLPLTPRLGRHS